jgi:general secretion pathway protein L
LNVLRIYFPAHWKDSASPCPWAICDESGEILQQGVSPMAQIPKTRDCIGILAADRVLIFTTNKPPGNKRRWRTALPFIAEEHALTDPEDIHALPMTSEDADKLNIAISSKILIKQIVTSTNTAGLTLQRLVSETLLPTLQADSWTIVWDGSSGFLRTSPTTGLALDNGTRDTPPMALTLSLNIITKPRKLELRLANSACTENLPQWSLPIPIVKGENWDWRRAPFSKDAPDLLCGEFAPPIRLFNGWSKLRPALLILLAAFALEVVGSHIEWLMLSHEKTALTQHMEQIFKNTFGEDSAIIDPPLQMQRNLSSLRHTAGIVDETDFLSLLDMASPVLSSLNEHALRSLNYESAQLELEVKLPNAAAIQSLVQKLQHIGMHVRTSDSHDLGDGTQAKLTLTMESLR